VNDSSKNILEQIALSCEQLKEDAKRNDFGTLAYILDLAITEARTTKEPIKPTKSGKVVRLSTKRTET